MSQGVERVYLKCVGASCTQSKEPLAENANASITDVACSLVFNLFLYKIPLPLFCSDKSN